MASLLQLDLRPSQYADYSFIFPVWLAGGIPVDFTGASAVMHWRANPTDTSPLVSIASGAGSSSGVIVCGPSLGGYTGDVPAGALQVNVSHTVLGASWNGIPLGYYNVLITWSNQQVTDYASGRVLMELGATH